MMVLDALAKSYFDTGRSEHPPSTATRHLRSALPSGSIGTDTSRYALADGFLAEDLGLIRRLIHGIVGQPRQTRNHAALVVITSVTTIANLRIAPALSRIVGRSEATRLERTRDAPRFGCDILRR
jgi:hypothetical protein